MGFFDFISDGFNSIKSGVSDAFSGIKNIGGSIFGGIKGIAEGAWNSVLKPIGTKVYDIGEKLVNKVVSQGEKVLDRFDKVNDSAVGALQGLGSFLGNPLAWLGIGIGAIIIIPKLIK
jgi:phage-related protein